MPEPIWNPSQNQAENSRMMDFMRFVNSRTGASFDTYDKLYHWSVDDVAAFWEAIWDYSDILHSVKPDSILEGEGMMDAVWFRGARLNFAENLLRFRDGYPAIISRSESGDRSVLSYRQLYEKVAACASGLMKLGVRSGDRVAALITNIPETVVCMLAATSIGAVWSSCSPDFGLNAVLDRFGQIQPKVLLTVSEYTYNGKRHSPLDEARQLTEKIEQIEHVIVVGDFDGRNSKVPEKAIRWDDLLDPSADEIQFRQHPFDHPVYIMYSSGTTGKPKCIVHGGGGPLLQHFKEHALHTDIRREDIVTYFTTCGWMMWNWLVGVLQTGATIVLYDGSPAYPDWHALWKTIEDEKITVFGTSPKFLSGCAGAGIVPGGQHDLKSLRAVLSTGAPLSDDNFDWVYGSVKGDVQLASISGGTDLLSCFMLGNPILPVYSGEIQCRGLGMSVETYDDRGNRIENEVGDLVCTMPFVTQPVGFWDDPDNVRYHDAYFNHFPGVWRHGDYIKIAPHGGIVVYGRSDATLNPGGVRIGTAEIYGPVESMDEIADSLVIGQKWADDTRIVLFVVLNEGVEFSSELQDKIKSTIRLQESPRHVPSLIIPIKEVPHTLNGKKVEMAVTNIVHGREVHNREALANPDSLEQFVNLEQLQKDFV